MSAKGHALRANSLALCMVVKDEINRIDRCLEPVLGLVDQVVIIDTGSTDGTPEHIERRYGIRVQHGRLEEDRCLTKIDMRNRAAAQVETDWVLMLDADEQADPLGLRAFRAADHAPGTAGYFGLWRNHVAQEAPFDDYKCFIFRRGFQARGLVHENVQIDIRAKGARAEWFDALVVEHHPEFIKHAHKTQLYHRRLMAALALEPHWSRYHWFLGYLQFQLNEWDAALDNLARAFDSGDPLFPVERLNSAIVQVEILCRMERPRDALRVLERAHSLWEDVKVDFEVAINTRMGPWLQAAGADIAAGRASGIRAYRFAR